MSFYFIISNKKPEENNKKSIQFSNKISTSSIIQEQVGSFYITHNGKFGQDIVSTKDNLFLVYGYIRSKTEKWNHAASNETLLVAIQNDMNSLEDSEFKKKYTGVYSIVSITMDQIKIITTLSSIHLLYYSIHNNTTVVSNSLILVQELLDAKMYLPSVMQLTCGLYKEVLCRKTVLENVFRLECNESVGIVNGKLNVKKLPFEPIHTELTDIDKIAKYVWDCYLEEVRLYAGENAETTVSLSGGLDSRLVLVAMNKYTKVTTLNHGDETFYETKVARKIADAAGVPFHSVSDIHTTFPKSDDLFEFIINGGGCIIEYVEMIKYIQKNNLPTQVILGDLFESLDARGTSFMSSRANRMSFVLNKLKGKKIVIQELNDQNFADWKISKKTRLLAQIEKDKRYLSKEFLCAIESQPSYISQLEIDLDDFLEGFSAYKVDNIEDLNEIFGWLTKARLYHCRQLFSFSGVAEGINLTSTDNFLARILGIPLDYRVRKRLIYLIANSSDFVKFKRIPTSQVPFVPTNTPLILRELILYIRYKLDAFIIKRSLKKTGNVKTRVNKALNCKYEYENPTAFTNLQDWFQNQYYNKELINQMFNDTKTGKAWPFTNMFNVGLAKCDFLMNKYFKSLK